MGDRHQISIHALREEGDQKGHTERRRQAISIHALREEGDPKVRIQRPSRNGFLSTPSARRATRSSCWLTAGASYFYPRPPRGGRPMAFPLPPSTANFYPRPPRGGRPSPRRRGLAASYFYPRPPRGGRLRQYVSYSSMTENFYPRPPRGGRHIIFSRVFGNGGISIHALREEGDKTAGKPAA